MPFTNFKTTCQLLLLCLCNSYIIWIEFFAFITCNDIFKLKYPAYCFLQHSSCIIIIIFFDRMPFPGGRVIGAENQTASVNNTTSIYMYNNTQLAQSTNSLPTDWGFIQLMTASVIPLILTLILVSMCIYYRCKRKARTAG